jgi:hypothetical protein
MIQHLKQTAEVQENKKRQFQQISVKLILVYLTVKCNTMQYNFFCIFNKKIMWFAGHRQKFSGAVWQNKREVVSFNIIGPACRRDRKTGTRRSECL